MAEQAIGGNRVVTGLVRFSYLNVFAPRESSNGTLEYSTAILIPKSDKETVTAIKKAIEKAVKDKWADKAPPASKLLLPLHDGDEDYPDDEAYQGHYYLNARRKPNKATGKLIPPKLYDASRQEVLDPDWVSGDYGRACITFYGFEVESKGVGVGLESIQFIKKGEPLGAPAVTADVFDDGFAVEDDIYA